MIAEEDTRIPPPWLNTAFLTKSLREGLEKPLLNILSCWLRPATAVGDNYSSIMFRAQLAIVSSPGSTPTPLSIVCKTLPIKGEFQAMVKNAKLFENEALRFRETLPAINQVLRLIDPDEQPLSAELIWFGTEPEEVIILQDLKDLGFSNLDRVKGLDLHACKMVLLNLAKLHAASLYLVQHDPDKLKGSDVSLWIDGTQEEMVNNLATSYLDNLIAEVSEWDDFPKDYVDRLKKLQRGVITEKIKEALTQRDTSLNVFQHGDCWINNFMFSKEDGQPSGLRFVDFQISCMNSAGVDLNNFLFTSPCKDIRMAKLEEMLRYYYDNFMDLVSKLHVTLPVTFSFDDLKREFRTRAAFGLFCTICFYPITISEAKETMEVNDLFNAEKEKRGQFQSQTFKDVFKMVFPYFIDCGVV